MPRQALLEQFFLWGRTARRQPEPTVSTATAEAPVQWYSMPAVTAEASVNGYSKHWRNIWRFHLDSLTSLGDSLIPTSSAQLCICLFLCKLFWILFTFNTLPVHLFPSKTSWNSTQPSQKVHMVLEGWPISSCKGETNCIFVWCCCNFSLSVECCYDNDTMLMLHY